MLDRILAQARLRARSLLRRRQVESELERELRFHLEREIDENIAHGMATAAAHDTAVRAFGGVERVKEECRDARGVMLIENLARDLRHTLRGLARQPMLVIAATTSIALGVGANLIVLGLASELLLAPPTARNASELVQIAVGGGSHVSYARWRDLDASGALDAIAGYQIEAEVNWLAGDAAMSITPMLVTANFFDALGVPLAIGRGFSSEEARAERDPRIAVVSNTFWRRELGGDARVIGRTLVLNGAPYTIVGVLAPAVRSFAGFGIAPSVYLPLSRSLLPDLDDPRASIVQLIGRLKAGQSVREGRAALDVVARRLGHADADTMFAGVQQFSRVGGMAQAEALPAVGAFLALLAIVALFVLLIACANVAGLLIARGTARRREIAIRLALGASRTRLVQQLLTEGLWLALIGTACGLAITAALLRVLNGLSLPISLPIELHASSLGAVLGYALALMIVTTLCCALAPALQSTRPRLSPALRREEPQQAHRRFTTRALLVTGQVAVSIVLLVTAFLFLRNLARTQLMNPGFEVTRALVAQLGLVQGRASATETVASLQAMAERVRALPGVENVTYSSAVPLTMHSGSLNGTSVLIDGHAEPTHMEFAEISAGPAYFATMGIRLLQGRELRATDGPTAPRVLIVNEELARRYFAGASPVGRRLRFVGRDDSTGAEIIGVVANSKYRTLGEQTRPAIYGALAQQRESLRLAYLIVRSSGDPIALRASVRRAIGSVDPSTAVDVQPMRSALAFALLPSRIGAAVLGSLGALGLVLAMLGLYAVVSYSVSRRTAEIAIRIALGASYRGVMTLVMADVAALVGCGMLAGLSLSALITRPLSTFLVAGLSPGDPLSFGGTALLLALVSLLASWLPARRAARVDPATAMRLE